MHRYGSAVHRVSGCPAGVHVEVADQSSDALRSPWLSPPSGSWDRSGADAVIAETVGIVEGSDLRREHRVVHLLARNELDDESVAVLRSLFLEDVPGFDWGAFLDAASRHRLLPLVGRNLERSGLYGEHIGNVPAVPLPHRHLLRSTYEANRARCKSMLDELEVILRETRRQGVPVAIRKGLPLSIHVYGDVGCRLMTDIDLLVARSHLKQLSSVLEGLGYQIGSVSGNGRTVEPLGRAADGAVFFGGSWVPPFFRTTGDPFLPVIAVGLATSLFGSTEYPIEEAVGEADQRLFGSTLGGVLRPLDFLADVASHLSKHARTVGLIEWGLDLLLSRILDVAELAAWVAPQVNSDQLRVHMDRFGITEAVVSALVLADRVYPDRVPTEWIDGIDRDLEYLDEHGGHEGRPSRWSDPDIVARVFDHARVWRV